VTFVKICGITRLEDARAALDQGATALGFVFWPGSPRYLEPARARAIVDGLARPAITVGVFVDQAIDEMNAVAESVGLTALQLHGSEPPAFARQLSRPVIKAIASLNGSWERDPWPPDVPILVDAHDPVRHGGTGTRADWPAAAALARKRRVVLAGGLTPENVAAAIAAVRPYGIDVSSGVEAAPGIKDREKLAALFDALEKVGG